jgi:hypothetical protein
MPQKTRTHKANAPNPRFYDAARVDMRNAHNPPDLAAKALLVLWVVLFFPPLFPALCGAALAAALPVLAAAHTADARAHTHAENTRANSAPYDERR